MRMESKAYHVLTQMNGAEKGVLISDAVENANLSLLDKNKIKRHLINYGFIKRTWFLSKKFKITDKGSKYITHTYKHAKDFELTFYKEILYPEDFLNESQLKNEKKGESIWIKIIELFTSLIKGAITFFKTP